MPGRGGRGPEQHLPSANPPSTPRRGDAGGRYPSSPKGGHYPPATLGEGEVPPQGCSGRLAGLPPACPACTKSNKAGIRDLKAPKARQGLAPCPGRPPQRAAGVLSLPSRLSPAQMPGGQARLSSPLRPQRGAGRTAQTPLCYTHAFAGTTAAEGAHGPAPERTAATGPQADGSKGLPRAVRRRLARQRDAPARAPSARSARSADA